MVKFRVLLLYEDEFYYRPIADGCSKEQLLDVLSRHLMLADVQYFKIEPIVSPDDVEFKEFTL